MGVTARVLILCGLLLSSARAAQPPASAGLADRRAAREQAPVGTAPAAPRAKEEPIVAAPAVARRPVRPLPGEEMQLKTRDGWTLTGNYLPADEDRPTVLLVHDGAGRRQDWLPLAAQLAKNGFGFLAWDLRGHGQSQNPPPEQPAQWNKFVVNKAYNEWDNMREDVAAAAAFLKEQGVPPERVVLGGADVGANIALKYAAVHPEIPAVFLLSPALNYREVLTLNALRAYRDRPILIVYAVDDRRFATEAGLLFSFARQSVGELRAGLLQVEKKHGTKMLAVDKDLVGRLLDWIETPVPPSLPAPAGPGSQRGASDSGAVGAGPAGFKNPQGIQVGPVGSENPPGASAPNSAGAAPEASSAGKSPDGLPGEEDLDRAVESPN